VLHLNLEAADPSSNTVVLRYEGVFDDPFEAEPFSMDNPGQGVRGTITRDAAFFLAGSGWYPVILGDIPETFRVSVNAPMGIYAVMEGRLETHADDVETVMRTARKITHYGRFGKLPPIVCRVDREYNASTQRSWRGRSLVIRGRFEANKMTVGFIRENINQPIRSLANVSHAMADAQRRLSDHPAGRIQVDSPDILGLESSNEDIAVPPGKTVAGIYHQPGRGNGRHPDHCWIHHARSRYVV
jgi:hypothetical protein